MVLKQISLNKRPLGTGKGEVAEVRHKESSSRQACMLRKAADLLKVHKRENFLSFDFEICTFS